MTLASIRKGHCGRKGLQKKKNDEAGKGFAPPDAEMHPKAILLETGHWAGDRRQACITMESSRKGPSTSTASRKAGRVGIAITTSLPQMWKPSPSGEAESHSTIWPSLRGKCLKSPREGSKELKSKDENSSTWRVNGEHATRPGWKRFQGLHPWQASLIHLRTPPG